VLANIQQIPHVNVLIACPAEVHLSLKKFRCICKYLFSDEPFPFLIQDKDKKKGKSKNKATNNNNQKENESKQEDKQGQVIANTVQIVAEAKMAAASIVAGNNVRNPEHETALKPDIKKETRKSILPGVKGTSMPRALPLIEKQKKNGSSSKGAVPRRKITPQGPPEVSKLNVRKLC